MRSITALAELAHGIFPPSRDLPEIPVTAYEYAIEDAWRQMVERGGGVYHMTADTPIILGTSAYSLPIDLIELDREGVYLGYRPRTVATVARVSEVVTVTTATDHDLAVGHEVALDGVTAAGGTEFDVAGTVASVPSTTSFTVLQAGVADDTGTGGEVVAAYTPRRLTLALKEDLAPLPDDQADTGTPQYYYYPSSRAIALYPCPDGSYPAICMEYDAEPSALIDRTADLPLPAVYERGLMAYAAALVGGRSELMPFFEEGVRLWKAARTRREEANRR